MEDKPIDISNDPMEVVTPAKYMVIAQYILTKTTSKKLVLTDPQEQKQWASYFGTSPEVASDMWTRIEALEFVSPYARPKHMLYGLLLMANYNGGEMNGQAVKCHPNTFNKWAWIFIQEIHDLHFDVIRFDKRLIGWDRTRTNAGITVDCVDTPINEPYPFDNSFWSHKRNGPSLKYEVARGIHNGYIVHWNGRFKPSVPDITIFREDLLNKLDNDEVCKVDAGCNGEEKAKPPTCAKSRAARKDKSVVRAKQENLFGLLKVTFRAFRVPWVHSHEKHELAMGAALVVLQLGLEHGTIQQWEPEYEAEYF